MTIRTIEFTSSTFDGRLNKSIHKAFECFFWAPITPIIHHKSFLNEHFEKILYIKCTFGTLNSKFEYEFNEMHDYQRKLIKEELFGLT